MGERIEDLLKRCTVKLSVAGKAGWGTGFFVAQGKILTCAHVVQGFNGEPIDVCWQSQDNFTKAFVKQLHLDPIDLALLEFTPSTQHPCVYLDTSTQPEDLVDSDDHLFIYGYSDDFCHGTPVTDQCEGLTGDSPPIIKFKAGQIRPGLSGSPLLNERTGKVCGVVKFTRDRSLDLGGGAIPSSTVLATFGDLKQLQTQVHRKHHYWINLLPYAKSSLWAVICLSLGVTALVVFVRFLGGLQPLELEAYDHFMQSRVDPGPDDRIRVITIDQSDIAAQEARGEDLNGSSLSNESLSNLIQKLDRLQVRSIALDLYRNEVIDPTKYADLAAQLRTQENLFVTCKSSYEDQRGRVVGVSPPPQVPSQRVGFSDFVIDSDDILRRHLLAFQPPLSSPCKAEVSFSLRVADYYLEQEGIRNRSPLTSDKGCQKLAYSNGATFPIFRPYTGGYQGEQSYGGCQILLNYRSYTEVAEQFSLEEVLDSSEQVLADEFKDRIVLIGVVHRDLIYDYWSTPYGSQDDQKLPGVIIQAQMVSQILSVVLDGHQPIWVLSLGGEVLWIFLWALGGGFLGWQLQSLRRLGFKVAIASVSLYSICLIIFQFQGWIPLVSPLLVLVITASGIWWLTLRLHVTKPLVSDKKQSLT